ncbi:MAG: LicD family protein [bacterium]
MRRKLGIDEIKKTELDLLCAFDSLCRENGLYYTLCGGTLLGAIRHKGFIPWDDDIDVFMPRPDYDRLLEGKDLDLSGLPSYMKVVSWREGESIFPFLKLVDTRTTIESKYTDSAAAREHIWIDIFPVEGLPATRSRLEKLYKQTEVERRLILLKYSRLGEGTTRARALVKPFIKAALFPFNSVKMCEDLNRRASAYDFASGPYVGVTIWGYGTKERMLKAPFLKSVPVEFEGMYFPAPSNYHEYLSSLYGDYMQLPPEDKRKTHDMTAYLDE